MSRKMTLAAAGLITVVGGAVFTPPSPAAASTDPPAGGWDHTWTSTDSGQGATVYVEEYGDIIEVCDSDEDGRSAAADVSWNSGASGFTLIAGGIGNCSKSTASKHNIPEGVTVTVSVYRSESGTVENRSIHTYVNDH